LASRVAPRWDDVPRAPRSTSAAHPTSIFSRAARGASLGTPPGVEGLASRGCVGQGRQPASPTRARFANEGGLASSTRRVS